jgi:hypothetical protein
MAWTDLANVMNGTVIDVMDDVAIVGGNALRGVFQNAFFEHLAGAAGQEGSTPTFGCKLVDAQAMSVSRGTTLTTRGTNYRVVGYEPDGDGWLLLILEKT